jgi:isopenicillin N synthase-like dioxygenase
MSVQADIAPPAASTAGETIPTIDIGPLLAGAAGAVDDVAGQVHWACTEIGFFFIVNHGMDAGIVERTFDASRQFFALPMAEKLKVRMNRHQCGYMPPDVEVINDTFETRDAAKNALNSEAFKFTFDLAPDDPDFGKDIRFRGHNKWPDPAISPGLREAFMDFHHAFQALGEKLLAPVAVSLDMPPDYFDRFFDRACSRTRIAYYPPVDVEANRISLSGHKDSSFLSLIPPATRPGLEIYTPSGNWIEQPVVPEGILVNTGTVLTRWNNDAYVATPHRVRADTEENRYSNIFFFSPGADTLLECLPSCQGPGYPAKYPPITFGELHAGFTARNFGYGEDWN